MEAFGTKLRRQRRRLGFTLDDLADRTGISKPYLSLIETGRVSNPPSDEKLRRLEQTLGFPTGELLTQAHLHRTPKDVRAVLQKLIGENRVSGFGVRGAGEEKDKATSPFLSDPSLSDTPNPTPQTRFPHPINLDDAYLSGLLHELVDKHAANIEHISTTAVPIINKVSAGYPKDFTDLSYPRGVADDYVGCPDVQDKDAFAARISGDSMMPKYREGDIVIFSPAAVPKNGDDCFIRFADGHTTFKRVYFQMKDNSPTILRLEPRNEKYRPQSVDSENISGVYKAVFKYQKVDEE
jgi:SOS-response transcriptional repressor LexA